MENCQPWTQTDLTGATTLGAADACYYALFVGEKCTTDGGVYKIDQIWYDEHSGGSFKGMGPPKGCGTVVENWVNLGQHDGLKLLLAAKTDLSVRSFLCVERGGREGAGGGVTQG